MFTYYYLILKSYIEREEGQDLIEYALIAGLIALAAVAGLLAMQGQLQAIWANLGASLAAAAAGGN